VIIYELEIEFDLSILQTFVIWSFLSDVVRCDISPLNDVPYIGNVGPILSW